MEFQQMMSFMRGMNNPQQFALSLLEQNARNNPFYQNLLSLAKNGQSNQIESIVRNLAKQQGINFDKDFQSFRSMFK